MSRRVMARDCPRPWLPQTCLLGHHGGMKGRRPEEIIGEWGIRDVTPPSAAERDRLAGGEEGDPLLRPGARPRGAGPPPRPTPRLGGQAHMSLPALGGPLPYMQRARQIDDEVERH